ncbi:MAG TPA: alpha-hydroxy acid oxidase [Egibacteraceae bacterium]|nr:alpha-hydroxy acid oxidase [Egibacteraceae bacterium]
MAVEPGSTPEDLEVLARASLHAGAYDYYVSGADDERTLRENLAAWERLRLRPRVLRDVSAVSTEAHVLGVPVAAPVLVAPTAYQRLAHPDGEAATASGAAAFGTVMVVSTFANTAMEEVAAAAPDAPRWFQLYVHTDRGLTAELVRRAAASGYRAIVLTVDLPVLGYRRRDERNNFALPMGVVKANLGDTPSAADVPTDGSALRAYAEHAVESSLTFDDLGWLRGLSDLPLVVKGVLRGDDAAACVAAGADAIVVSNHGGRQLDGAIPTAEALPDVVRAVGERAEVYVDGGIRRGTDVVRALALGARAVLLGRPVLWGLAVDGADGVRAVLENYRVELARAMALCGTPAVTDVTADLLAER